jgi:SAM-dependent methyltransferase
MTEKGQRPFDTVIDQHFWMRLWEEREKKAQSTVHRDFIRAERWDQLSADFGDAWGTGADDPERDEVLLFLKENNILHKGMKILDLGSGAGRFAIPFARMGAHVTALDISEEMLRCLEKETAPELAPFITPVQSDWHAADVAQLQFENAFDLSFAHMTPAITGPKTFLKFLSTSRQWFVFVGWDGDRRQNTVDEVWRHLTGKEPERNTIGDVIYPFNLVYSMGYRPRIDFQPRRYEHMVDIEKETDLLLDMFLGLVDDSPKELRERIVGVLKEMGEGTKVNTVTKGCIGRMVWAARDELEGCG